jgi:hypothetical protein
VVERIAEIIVLCEDLTQGNLVYWSLIKKGHNPRTIRLKPGPSGRGSGEQYVRESFPKEVAQYRNRAARRSAALVAVIDADTRTLQKRERELQMALEAAGQEQRKPEEAIATLIPRRHVETWILCLTDEHVDETKDYSKRDDISGRIIRQAGEGFYDWSRPHYRVPAHCVASLRKGLGEFRRVP